MKRREGRFISRHALFSYLVHTKNKTPIEKQLKYFTNKNIKDKKELLKIVDMTS